MGERSRRTKINRGVPAMFLSKMNKIAPKFLSKTDKIAPKFLSKMHKPAKFA